MLEPEGRQLLLDCLRPPAGYELDRAVGTTYSLDLMSLLAAPLGFALFDREATDGRLVADPIALVEAVRRLADRIDVFCQAGQIAIPHQHRAILAYIEASVHQATPPNPDAIFHPKVWVVRYRQMSNALAAGPPGSGSRPDHAYRLLCLSRNLTFDRSWDTVLVLDGEVREDGSGDARLSEFIGRLPDLTVAGMTGQRAEAVRELARELRAVVFTPPDGFERVAFWPMGLEPEAWPFEGRIDRMLVVSPFLTAGCLARLGQRRGGNLVVSRSEALDGVGSRAITQFAETFVLSPVAAGEAGNEPEASQESLASDVSADEAVAEQAGVELRGLHAKLYVADSPWRARVWTGSANATDAAFGGNVEFLVELEGPKARFGIDALIGDRRDGVGLRKLLEPYRPANEEPSEMSDAEQLERRLDRLRRMVARRPFVARVEPGRDATFGLRVEVTPPVSAERDWWPKLLGQATVRMRPLTFGDAFLRPPSVVGMAVTADFGAVSFEGLTSFVVVEIEETDAEAKATIAFVVNAQLVGAPEDRRERTLVTLLRNRGELVRFLLLLLGQVGVEDLAKAVDVSTGEPVPQGGSWPFAQTGALLETMVRALGAEPVRLDEVHRLIVELESTEAGRRLLPPGWRSVWEPIWRARLALEKP